MARIASHSNEVISAWCIIFPSVFGVDISFIPQIITTIPANFNFDFSGAIDVAKCALRGKVMQGSPCSEVCTLTNENGQYIMKLNNLTVTKSVQKATILKKDP